MREILFRGKRMNEKGWVYGYFIENEDDIYRAFIVSSVRWNVDADRDVDLMETEVYEVIPETVGQFTGLTDKDGNKIFEGDILHIIEKTGTTTISHSASDISINSKKWKSEYNYEAKFTPSGLQLLNYYCSCMDCEIIGNIHDNPELLK